MGPGIVVLIWVGIALVAAVFFVLSAAADKKRREELRKLADSLKLEYRESLEARDNEAFAAFGLANRGRARRATNVIVADSGELRMAIFDYQYTTGGGNNSSTHRQTVVFVEDAALKLPEFSLSPESIMHRLGEFLGVRDIDFDDDPEFSKHFLLQGSDESAIREFFGSELRRHLRQIPGVALEGKGSHFIFYQPRKRRQVEEIKPHMELAFRVYKFLSAS